MRKRLTCLICLGLMLSVMSNTSAQLLVHYKLDETAGTMASDSSGKGNDGTLSGDPQWAAGWMDGAADQTFGSEIGFRDELGGRGGFGSLA